MLNTNKATKKDYDFSLDKPSTFKKIWIMVVDEKKELWIYYI